MSTVVPVKLTVITVANGEGSFTAFCPEIHGAISEGKTGEEAFKNLKDAAVGLIAMRAEMELDESKWDRVTNTQNADEPLIPAWA